MQNRFSSAVAVVSSWGLKLTIFGILGAVGWWGHKTHWTLPGLHTSTSEATAETKAPEVSKELPKTSDFPSQLPSIRFDSADAARNCGIKIDRAQVRSMDEVIVANGVVGFDMTRLAQLATRVPGIVWRVEKWVGDSVQSGDVLVIVDSAEVGQAKASLLESAVVHNLKEQTFRRLDAIPDAIARRELREAEAALEVARVQRFNAVQKLVNFGFPIQADEIGKLPLDQLTSKLQLLGLPASVHVETSSANLIPLIAPFSGVITKCNVALGEMVDPSKPQYVLADMRRMWINLDIRQEDAARLQLGATAMIRSEGDVEPLPCRITWIGAEIDPKTRTIQARAEADNPVQDTGKVDQQERRKLRVNAFCTASIQVEDNPDAVVVHNDALHWVWEIGHQVVFVASEDHRHFEPRIVTKGLVRDEFVQIVSGLKAGERIVTGGSRILSSELSERLQLKVGENADAVRKFDHEHIPTTALN